MFTWTHALAGWWLGRKMNGGENILVPLACLSGAIIPDLSLITQITFNLAEGRSAESYISPVSRTFTQITHSIPVWMLMGWILFCVAWNARNSQQLKLDCFSALFCGAMFIHIIPDAFTHKGIPLGYADYLWPSHFTLSKITGIWTYRASLNSFWPRPWELVIDIALVIAIIVAELRELEQRKLRAAKQRSSQLCDLDQVWWP